MKKQLLSLIFAIVCLNGYSQIRFEKGYYIDNSNQKIECLIKNIDWGSNPTNFDYKISETSESKNIDIQSVKEFGIYNFSKYIRESVKIDQSSEEIDKLTQEKNPIFANETLFLKVLVEGNANLYYYENRNFKRFFYSKDNTKIEQLVYKSYKNYENNIETNNLFKQQLWDNFKCTTIEIDRINELQYEKGNLTNFFVDYNKCNNSEFTNYTSLEKKVKFKLSIRTHLNTNNLLIENYTSNFLDTDFGNKFGVGFGAEAELVLPFNKNKWSIVIEPTYRSYKSQQTSSSVAISGGKLTKIVDYNSVELPLSLRYSFFLNNDSKIFINASYIVDFPFNSSIDFKREDNTNYQSLKIKSNDNFGIGVGYKFQNKYSVELRYESSRNILISYSNWVASYNPLSIIFGYSIF